MRPGEDPAGRQRSELEQEQPPLLQGLVLRGSGQLTQAIQSWLRARGRTTLMWAWGGAVIAAFLAILVAGLAEATDLGGIAGAVFGAFFIALLVAGAGAWILLSVLVPSTPAPVDEIATSALTALLAPTLRELNVVRAEIVRKVRERSKLFVPLGTAAGFGFWIVARFGDDPPGVLGLFLFLGIGAIAGEAWAAHKLSKEYSRLYKRRVLPLLAARFGDLTYREASAPDVRKLSEHQVLRDFDTVKAEDELAGTHRGLPLRITEVTVSKRSGKHRRTVFDGLLIDLVLPRSLTGTTAVVADEGLLGNLTTRLRSNTLPRVRLEDPRFEERYEVYGSDQIEARALLTPAFMERFTALSERSGFSLPGALAEGNRLIAALPKRHMGDLFEPPPYWKPAGGGALVALSQDIEAVLKMADAVIDLDFWATQVASRNSRAATPNF